MKRLLPSKVIINNEINDQLAQRTHIDMKLRVTFFLLVISTLATFAVSNPFLVRVFRETAAMAPRLFKLGLRHHRLGDNVPDPELSSSGTTFKPTPEELIFITGDSTEKTVDNAEPYQADFSITEDGTSHNMTNIDDIFSENMANAGDSMTDNTTTAEGGVNDNIPNSGHRPEFHEAVMADSMIDAENHSADMNDRVDKAESSMNSNTANPESSTGESNANPEYHTEFRGDGTSDGKASAANHSGYHTNRMNDSMNHPGGSMSFSRARSIGSWSGSMASAATHSGFHSAATSGSTAVAWTHPQFHPSAKSVNLANAGDYPSTESQPGFKGEDESRSMANYPGTFLTFPSDNPDMAPGYLYPHSIYGIPPGYPGYYPPAYPPIA
uniref:Uncharacterized protein n=1 Tax=Glossina palpalis gambiensis TaxID=67801 RepID=A0A1B0AU44_9MUSC